MFKTLLTFLAFAFFSMQVSAFALLSHQAIIDATWKESIVPLLKHKYPNASNEQLKEAHAYVYGGSLIPDIGYYPFGSIRFTHLLHYVRSGDFIENALLQASDINEYAFALGMLCHYHADRYGHLHGTNPAVAVLFPKARKKHGDTITYEMAPSKHTRTEFGFDVIQAAKGNYAPEAQYDIIGFKVSQPLLEKAFLKTYGITLQSVFRSVKVAIETFRFTVKQMFPQLTKIAWNLRSSMIVKANPLAKREHYTHKMDRRKYREAFGGPKLKSEIYAVTIGLIPKIGPFAGMKFKEPNEEVEKMFDRSYQMILTNYRKDLKMLEDQKPSLQNVNFDTGRITQPGEYEMADKNYYALLKKHYRNKFEKSDKDLDKTLLAYFNKRSPGSCYSKNAHSRKLIAKSVDRLQQDQLHQD